MQPKTTQVTGVSRDRVLNAHRLIQGFLRAVALLAVALALPGGLLAQQFAHIDPLHFTKAFGADDPLPQVLAVASTTAANFGFSVSASTSSGGNWLTASPSGNCCVTPRGVRVVVTTSAAMAVGTYTGQVVFTSGALVQTVPVTLVVAPVAGTFFDNTPGQVSFSMKPGGHPPSQVVQVRNAGVGSLNWTLTTATSNGGNWLTVSSSSGTAPSLITVGINTANLPNGGSTAGTYSGQLLFQTAGGASIITVPIGLTIATNAMSQVNALSFTKPYAGIDPLDQTITIASQGAEFGFSTSATSGSLGGTWLSVSPSGNCCVSPRAITISANPIVSLAAGSYFGQILADNGSQLMVIPITLTIAPLNNPFFDNTAGQLSFSLPTAATNPPPDQLLQIRNAGPGTLNWTLTPVTHDGGNWLTVSSTSGTAPSQISIGIVPANLPNGALTGGVYTANLLFLTSGSSITVPITVAVGQGFQQVNGISFTMQQAGPNPLPQNVTIASLGAAMNFSVAYSSATGGNWLSVTPSGNCCVTPRALVASVNAPAAMPAGTYTAQIIAYSGATSVTVPVTLTVAAAATTFFDNVPGQLSFTMTLAGAAPSPQVLPIRNRGTGTLNWSVKATTFDGGSWLTVAGTSGTAPSLVTVGIVPANLPNGGLVAGVFTGQLLFDMGGGSTVTVPVSMQVGANVFGQINGIHFSMQQGGANPLPQVITATHTASPMNFSVAASTGNGGAWLSVTPTGNCCTTTRPIKLSVAAPVGMLPGTYTAQVSLYTGATSQTVPVTLTVSPTNQPFFDNVPGQLSYSLATHAGNPAPQTVQLRNRGTGTLNWTAQTSTFDGNNWLTVSAVNGTAPSNVSIGIVTQNLPNQGLVAGVFTGQVLFLSGLSSVTVPISVVVGGNGYAQVNGLQFTMPQAGANPLPQIVTATTIGAGVNFSVAGATGNGGNWMTVSPTGNCCSTPRVLTITVAAPVGMAAGTYTAEVILDNGSTAMVVPVTLTVAPGSQSFFDNVQGQMYFGAATGGSPASQSLTLRRMGTGPLNWTVTPMTFDNGAWLQVSTASGSAPSTVTVSIVPGNLPSLGLVAGQYTGQLLFESGSSSVTVPVSVQLGTNIFTQMSGLNFSMPFGGANPLSQTATVNSNGSALNFTATASAGNGGSWLSITPSGNCCATSRVITFNVAGSPGGVPVTAGVHTGQAVFNGGTSAVTVPVTLTVQSATWGITKTHAGNFSQGQQNATYTVTVTNPGGGGATSGTVTVAEAVPAGMTLVSMAGSGWSCPAGGSTCTRSNSLAAGASYPAITVTVNVSSGAPALVTNQVSVTGGGLLDGQASNPTIIISGPTPVSVVPGSGSGTTQTFTGVFAVADDYHNLAWIQMLFGVSPDGGGQSFCFVHYDVAGNGLWFYGDGGFFVGPVTPGTLSNGLQNSLCALNTSASSVVGAGTTLTLNANLVFKQASVRNIYMRTLDRSGIDSGWVQRGTWTSLAATLGTMTVGPNAGSGSSQTFTLTYPDPPGFAGSAFGWVQFLIAAAANGGGQPFCFLHYDRGGNGLWMYSSDVGFFLGPVSPGAASNALDSSACSINTG
ncbi:beta strand repeat-containing protein, partial [Paludibaculum fermentans]|uniref:beta strand repeat-containing protein n=1 Tax=Paludibaculum fermentans TaxID=1473598 RepID=UPI003EB6FFDB